MVGKGCRPEGSAGARHASTGPASGPGGDRSSGRAVGPDVLPPEPVDAGTVGGPERVNASQLPTCRYCGRSIAWYVRRRAWRHIAKGVDHAPLPARMTETR